MDLLRNTVQTYAWGSATAIPELLGVGNPDGAPQAELWMGAHPSAPSNVVRGEGGMPLDAVIADDPVGELGAEVAGRFGGRLPFLLKVLAAQKALSIQLHPDREQAQAGFAAEEARGVPRNARERVYVDDWPKPEVLCALTPFEVLAGLRPAPQAADVLDGLGVKELNDLVRALRSDPEPATVGRTLAVVLGWPEGRLRDELVQRVLEGAAKAAGRGGEHKAAYEAVGRIAADHPGDVGVVCSLLMNHAVVEPGQALFMAAGGVHAYIRGTGVELMANSDNVIRAGLTPKHIDIPELMRVLDPAVPVPTLTARRTGPGVEEFDTPVPEFRLRRLTPDGASLDVPAPGLPRILLCVDGEAEVSADGRSLTIGRGQSCYLSARDVAATVSGDALLFLASPGD
ncbi:MAG TPA: mannose-6-phosphate isomerase, class I [Actinocrinis sp.]|uniref:mannose-6-phosphate isomerase, class I n=1 Tax=Actinocrinis sp. TaxID=1920516 RepID=UPI002DDCB3CB|nr:mannose-6-phosphate isomerase, class I [Actinocrinis sp.]HEV3168687.1 mannose-6-phosphate isomerase, class I [Actinocrinis sp.]